MKKYLTPFLNWRVLVLTVLAMAALVLILGEAESLKVFLSIKAVGFALGYLCYRLSKHWDERGLIDELNVYSEN